MVYLPAVYKILAQNDTSNAKGHQGGPLIPKAIAWYFPTLPATTTALSPTVDVPLSVELWLGATAIGSANTRYQHQTWGAKRSVERRITGELVPLLQYANKNDLLVIERDSVVATQYRLTLHKAGTAAHTSAIAKYPGRRWGAL